MKRRYKILMGIAALPLLATACVDSGIPTPGHGEGREGWWEETDPNTGRTFRCLYWSLSDSTAMWCYEPNPT